MDDEPKHSGRRPVKPLAKPVRLYPKEEELIEDELIITDPEGPRHPELRKLLSVISLIIVFVIFVYLLRFPISSLISPKLYISLTAENTIKSLRRELMTFSSGNNVIKHGIAIMREPSEHTLQLSAGAFGLLDHTLDLSVLNDNKRDQLMLEISNESSESASFYLSDALMGLRINKDVYSADPGSAGDELNALLEASGSNLRLPLGLDMSYNAFKRLITGGSLSAVDPAYDRIYNRYGKLVQSLFDIAKLKKSGSEKIELGDKAVRCNVVTMQIPGKDMREWLIKLADTIKNDDDLTALTGSLKDDLEIMVRGQRFFHNGTIYLKFLCLDNRIVSVRYSHLESQMFFEVSTRGEKYRLDNISFAFSGANNVKFQALGSHISAGEFRTNLYVSGIGKLDALNELQIVWDPSEESNNVTVGKFGKVINRFTFSENSDGLYFNTTPVNSNGISASYKLTKMNRRPEWPDDTHSFSEINMNSIKSLLKS